jgi:hypothetical protein
MADVSNDSGFSLGLANIASQNSGPTAMANQANTNANTQVQQQSAQAQGMENQILKARMPLILSRLHGQTAAAGDQSGVADEDGSGGGPNGGGDGPNAPTGVAAQDKSAVAPDQNFYQPDKIAAGYRSHFFVPAVTPQESDSLSKAFAADPTNKYGVGPQSVMAQRDFRIAQQTQQSQLGANNEFDKMHAVTDAEEGGAMDILEASHPDTVAAIRRQFSKDPDAAMDEDAAARMFAAHAAGEVHQYTGRKAVEDKAGVYRDEVTQIPIPGVEKVGLSTDQYLKLAHEAIAPTQMDDGNGGKVTVPAWRAAQIAGAKNINGPGDWIMVNASKNGLPGGAATLSPNSAPKQAARKTAQSALDTAQQTQAAAPPPVNGTPPSAADGMGVARNAQGNIDPKLTDALHDTDFDYKPSNNGQPYTPQIGHTPPQPVLDDMNKQTAARNQLKKDTNDGVGSSAAALTMYKAAQDVLAKGNYNGGAWNQELAKYSRWLPADWQSHMTGDYQEVAKYLGQAALQSGKGIFAKMTQQEAQMITKQLNPSPGMDPDAMRDMIAKGAKIAQYSLDSAKRVPAYLNSTKDATQFATWNQKHLPMETETQVTPATPNAGVNPPKYNDAQVRAYMQKHGLTDEQATRKALGT